MTCYEHTFIAKEDLPESQIKNLLEKYQEIIDKNSGSGVVPYLPLPELKKSGAQNE